MVIGWARGGRLEALGRAPLRGAPLLVAAVAMVAVAAAGPLPQPAAGAIHGAAYALALAALWLNRGLPWALPVLAGLALNAAVIALNGGRMPVAPDALARVNHELGRAAAAAMDARHVIGGPGTRLAALGDTIAVAAGRIGVVASPGDLLMALGIAGLVQGHMGGARAGPPRISNV